jgi:hypothetical protein
MRDIEKILNQGEGLTIEFKNGKGRTAEKFI